jgi:hypothetical protein
MFSERLMGHLHVHLGAVLLQAELGMLLEPPWGNLPLAYPAQNWNGRWMIARIGGTLLGKPSEVMGQNFCSHTKRFDKHLWEVDGHLADDRRSHHPHSLARLVHLP